jgi:hypothetical protein
MFLSVKGKTAGDIIYPQCFFQLSRVEKYSLLGAGEHGKLPVCGKKPIEHLHPLQVCI